MPTTTTEPHLGDRSEVMRLPALTQGRSAAGFEPGRVTGLVDDHALTDATKR